MFIELVKIYLYLKDRVRVKHEKRILKDEENLNFHPIHNFNVCFLFFNNFLIKNIFYQIFFCYFVFKI